MSEKRVNIKITASTNDFNNAIKKAQKEIDGLADAISDLSSSKFGSELEKQISNLSQEIKTLESQLDSLSDTLGKLGKADFGQLDKAFKDISDSSDKVNKGLSDVKETLSKVDKADLGGLDKSFTKVNSTVDNLSKEIGNATDKMKKDFNNLADSTDKVSKGINDIDSSGLNKVSSAFEKTVKDILKADDAVDNLAKSFKNLDGAFDFNKIMKFTNNDLTAAKQIMDDLVENGGDLKKVLEKIDADGLEKYKDSFYGKGYKSKDSWADNSNKKNTNSLVEGFVSGTVAAKAMEHSIGGVADAMREATEGIREMPNSLQEAVSYFHNLNQEVADNKNKIDELNKSLSDSRKKYDDLNKERDEAQKYNDSFDRKERELVDEYNKANDAMKKYKEQMADVNKWREKWNAQNKELREQMANVNKELAEQENVLSKANKASDEADDKCDELGNSVNKLTKDYNDLQKAMIEASDAGDVNSLSQIANDWAKVGKELEDVKEQYKDAYKAMEDADDARIDAADRLEALEQEKKALQELYNIRKQAAKDLTDRDGNSLKDTFAGMNDELKKLEDQTDKARKAVEDFWDEFGEASVGNQAISQTSGAMMKKTKEEMQNLTDEIDKYKKAVSDAEKEAQGYADGFEQQYKAYESLSKRVRAYLEDEEKSVLQREKVAKSFKDLADEMEKVYADSKKFSNAELIDKTLKDAAEYIDKLDLASTKNVQKDLERLGEIIDDKTKKIKRFKALSQEFGSEDGKKAFGLEKQAEQLRDYARTTDFVIEAVDELNKAFAKVKVGDDDNLRIRGRIELLENYGKTLAKTAADIRNKYHDIEKAEDVYNAATPQERAELDKYEAWQKNRKEIEKYTKAIEEYRAAIKDMGGQVDSRFLDEFGKFDARKFIEDFDKMGTSSAVLQKQMNAVKSELLENIKAEKENAEAMRQNAKAAADAAKTKLDQAKADNEAAQAAERHSRELMKMSSNTEDAAKATKQYEADSKKLAETMEKVAKAEQEYKDAKDNSDNYDKKRVERAQQLIKAYNEQAEAMRKMGLAAKDLGREDIEKFDRSLASLLDRAGTFGNDLPKNFADFKEDIKGLFADMDGFDFGGVWDGIKDIGSGILAALPTKFKVAAAAALALGVALKKCAEVGINQFGRGMDTIKGALSKFTGLARDVGQEVRDAFENITGMHLDMSSLMEIPVEFESVMYQVGAITGTLFDAATGKADATNAAFQQLINKARQVGGETRYSATEAAEAMVLLGQSGWTAKDMMEGLDSVLHMATIENMSLADSASFLSDALNTMGMQTYQASDAADMLVATSISANTSVSQLKNAYNNAASTAGTLGVSMSDLNTVLGVMADKGIKGAKAGTALKNLMANMSAPTEKQTKYIKQYGLESAQAAITTGKLVEGIQLMQGKLGGLSAKQKTAVITTIAGKEALSGVAALMNTSADDMNKLKFAVDSSTKSSKFFAESLGLIDKAGNMINKTTGKVTDSFAEMKESQEDAYKQWENYNKIMNEVDDAGNSLVDVMQVVGGTTTDLGAIVHKLGEDGSVTKEQVEEVVEVFNKLNDAGKEGSSVLSEYGIEIAKADDGSFDFSATLKNLGERWDQLSDSQKAALAEQLGISGSVEELNELFADNGEQIESLIDTYDSLKGVAEHVAEAFDANFKGSLLSLASAMQERLLQVFDKCKESLQGLTNQFTEFFRIWNNMGQENANLSGLSGALEYLKNISVGWGEAIRAGLSQAISSINEFVNGGSLDNLLQVGTNIIDGITNGIRDAAKSGALDSAIEGAINKIATWFSTNLDTIVEAGRLIMNSISKGISENSDEIGEAIKSVLEMQTSIDRVIAKEKWKLIGDNIVTFIVEGIQSKVSVFGSALEGFLSSGFGEAVGKMLSGNPIMFDAVSSWGLKIGEWLREKLLEAFDVDLDLSFGNILSKLKDKMLGTAYAEGPSGGATPLGGSSPIDIINQNLSSGKSTTDATAASIGEGISSNIISKLETMDSSQLAALSTELQNLQTTVQTVATGIGASFTAIQDSSRVSFMGLFNIINNQMTNVANSIRTQMVNCANIFRNQFLSMANVARNQMVNVSNIVRNQAVSWSNVIRNQVTNARNALTSQFLSMAAVARTQMVNISNIVRNQATAWANIIRNQGNNAKAALTSSFAGMAAAAASGMAKVLSTVRSYMSQVVAATNRTMTMNFKVNRSITTTNTVRTVAAPAAASAMYAANTASTYSLRSGDTSALASRASSAITSSSSKGAVSSNSNDAITLEIPLILDGKEVARSTAKYVDGELKIKQKRDDRKRGVK